MGEFGQNDFVLPIATATAPEMIERFDRLIEGPDMSDHFASIVAQKRRELEDQYDLIVPRS
jgi:hypothetical protein